jgi:hypothetical protein
MQERMVEVEIEPRFWNGRRRVVESVKLDLEQRSKIEELELAIKGSKRRHAFR